MWYKPSVGELYNAAAAADDDDDDERFFYVGI